MSGLPVPADHNNVKPSIEGNNTNGLMDNVKANASAAVNAVQNHPLTQNVTNGPVADKIKTENARTQNEFSNLAASRQTPSNPAATGQPLTHYHSFFSSLLSWENPRASGIAFAATVLSIFALRYLDILRYTFKVTYISLFVTLVAEVAGKALFSHGFVTQIRPKKYFTISKETLDSALGDIHELINFFVIESQRIFFVENVAVSAAAFLGAFISYFMIKFTPVWGLALITASLSFLGPLVYSLNKEFIDHHLNKTSDLVNKQTEQYRQIASQSIAQATETTKSYVGEYSNKATEMIRNRSVSPISSRSAGDHLKETTNGTNGIQGEAAPAYQADDFPSAPKNQFKSAPSVESTINQLKDDENDPLIAS